METIDDLFAGAGGWDVAAASLGIHARGVENMKAAVQTREAAGLTTIHDDVWTFEPDGKATGLIASPPCQTFSQAGKGAGRKALDDVLTGIRQRDWLSIERLRKLGEKVGDERTALVLTPLHFALTNPAYRWLAWEQVPTVLPVWEACAERLRVHGWSAWAGILNAEQYGVPQTRRRAVLIASRDHEVGPPTPTHSRYHSRSPEKLDDGVLKWVSVAEALGWTGDFTMTSNYGTGGDPSNRGVRHGWQPAPTVTSKIDRNVVEGDWVMATTNVRDGEYLARSVHGPAPTITGAARSFKWGQSPVLVETPGVKGGNMQERATTRPGWCYERPATTVVGSFHPEVIAAPGYRTTVSRQNAPDSVRVSVAEAGVLQSFPADYPWQGAKTRQYLQVGNAIPPLLAKAVIQAATTPKEV